MNKDYIMFDDVTNTIKLSEVKLGDRAKFWYNGTAYWGPILKINKKTFKIGDHKHNSSAEYTINHSECVIIKFKENCLVGIDHKIIDCSP